MSALAAPLDPIQMLWIRGDLSRVEQLSIRSFLAQGHPVHLYSYDPPANCPPGVTFLPADEITPASLAPLRPLAPFSKGSMASFSDLFRYQLLTARGGWWVDLDVIATRPFRTFPPVVVASTDEHGHRLCANNFVMRFPAAHPVPVACLQALEGRDISTLGIDETGPLLLDRILGPEGRAAFCQPPEVFAPVPWNDSVQVLYPRFKYLLTTLRHRLRRPHLACRFTRATHAVHLWNETWRLAGLDKNALYPATSLYERFHLRYPS